MTMTFETAQLKQACMDDPSIMTKLSTIRTDAPGFGTPGPESLEAHARHVHVLNETGIAWVYGGHPVGKDQRILALGRKDNKARRGNSGYYWNKFGDI